MPRTIRHILNFALLFTFTLFPASAAFAQDSAPIIRITQVDNSNFPRITVYVSAVNASGEPVAVDPSTIQVYENGQLMQAATISGQGDIGQLTTLLVIDTSGSMEKSDKIQGARDAAKAYLDLMRPGDQAGVVSFNTEVKVIQPLTADKAVLVQAIDSLQPVGNTAMFDALVAGVDVLKDVSGRKAIILLSDGLDNRSKSGADDVINAIGPAGLSISTIGLGDPKEPGNNFGLDEPALKSLAERAGGFYGFATAPQDLLALYQQRGRELQNEFSFTYVTPATIRDGVNRDLRVSFGGEALSTSGRYNPGGVLPEVSAGSWPLFTAILLGLVLLLALPFIISRGALALAHSKKTGGNVGIRSGQPAASRSNAAKGRVRLK